MAAPFLMSMVGKMVKDKALDAVGLGKFLGTQKSSVKSAMPSGLLSSLGAGFLGKGFDAVSGIAGGAKNLAGDAVGAAGNVAGAGADAGKKLVGGAANMAGGAIGDVANVGKAAGGGIMKWLLGLLVPILIGVGVWKSGILSTATDMAGDAVSVVGDVAGDAAGAVGDVATKAGDMAGDAAGAVGDAAGAVGDVIGSAFAKVDAAGKAALDKITFGENSAGSQMMAYIDGGFKGDGKFTFNNLNFASGSAQIDGTSGVGVDNIAAILAAYPAVNIHVTGYTDSTGDAAKNLQLSTQRANAVKARLMGKNVAGNRVTTKGLGSADPVADNATKEGQAQNRRIEVTIVK